jgi:hypothetical protein
MKPANHGCVSNSATLAKLKQGSWGARDRQIALWGLLRKNTRLGSVFPLAYLPMPEPTHKTVP